jgi:hypothetical protein
VETPASPTEEEAISERSAISHKRRRPAAAGSGAQSEATLRRSTKRQAGGVPPLHAIDPLAPTLFHQPWWLDVATGGQYDVVESRHHGRVVGRMPYMLERRLGHTVSVMPPLTHVMGPAVDDGEGTATARFLQRLGVTRELITKLPAASYFRQKLHRGITDALAFQMEDHEASVQFTHEIAPRPIAEIWQGMRDKTRNMVRKAEKHFVTETLDDPDRFARLYLDNLAARRRRDRVNVPVCRALIAASLARDCGRIYAARQASGDIVAATFCAWDATSAYYLMTTRSPDSGNSAVTLLLWQAIRDAMARGLIFDFDGIASAGAVLFYAGFGGKIESRYIATKRTRRFRVMNMLRPRGERDRSTFN